MGLYAIADLHLSLGSPPKPMDRFGSRWTNHTDKLRRRWEALITDRDTVILPGDFSWAMNLDEAAADFAFLESLPGKKLLGKGNHDYWWTSGSKMKRVLEENGIHSVGFLSNNALFVPAPTGTLPVEPDKIVCGSRGWFLEEKQQTAFDTDYDKLVNRECVRLELSLNEGERLRRAGEELLVFLHFPPVFGDFVCQPILDVLAAHSVRRCFYGHIHGKYDLPAETVHGGVTLCCISADFLDFVPLRIR